MIAFAFWFTDFTTTLGAEGVVVLELVDEVDLLVVIEVLVEPEDAMDSVVDEVGVDVVVVDATDVVVDVVLLVV